VLRDVEGWTTPEVSELLEITDTNQRVLLHRARGRVRRAVEAHLAPLRHHD
jgi:RNA polymerase sigma-70 factor (ECF subfamily)